eukprot:COSAG02_NODE_4486_length_5301_cov_3.420223_6_plen_105_part_00
MSAAVHGMRDVEWRDTARAHRAVSAKYYEINQTHGGTPEGEFSADARNALAAKRAATGIIGESSGDLERVAMAAACGSVRGMRRNCVIRGTSPIRQLPMCISSS